MSETRSGRSIVRLGVVGVLAALAVAGAALYLMTGTSRNDAVGDQPPRAAAAAPLDKALATGAVAAFVVHAEPAPVAAATFKDAEGRERSLAEWRGKTVLVNLWATWCAPCREEMPALSSLQRELGGDDFEVVAISIDQKGPEVAAKFLSEIGVDNLPLYIDSSTKILNDLKGVGLPSTILIDREGYELGRLLGPAVWDSEEAKRLIESALAAQRDHSS